MRFKTYFIISDLFHVCVTALWVVSKIKRYINIVYYYFMPVLYFKMISCILFNSLQTVVYCSDSFPFIVTPRSISYFHINNKTTLHNMYLKIIYPICLMSFMGLDSSIILILLEIWLFLYIFLISKTDASEFQLLSLHYLSS